MFAFGITGIDLSSSIRYFDIILQKFTVTKTGSTSIKSNENVIMQPCDISQWSNINSAVSA